MPHKIKGTITVEFEMEGAEFQLSVNDVADQDRKSTRLNSSHT